MRPRPNLKSHVLRPTSDFNRGGSGRTGNRESNNVWCCRCKNYNLSSYGMTEKISEQKHYYYNQWCVPNNHLQRCNSKIRHFGQQKEKKTNNWN